jgi:hypothetical protein
MRYAFGLARIELSTYYEYHWHIERQLKEPAMPTSPANIRRLFLEPEVTYRLSDAAALLGITPDELRGRAEGGEIEMENGRISWAELVSFAMDFWPQEAVEEALGGDVAEAIPEPLRLVDVRVRIPRMQLVVLERLAAAGGETVSIVLARELRDLVSEHAERLDAEVPGLAEALFWPEAVIPAPRPGHRSGGDTLTSRERSPNHAPASRRMQVNGRTARRAQ